MLKIINYIKDKIKGKTVYKYFGLCDESTGVLLILADHYQTIRYLNEFIFDTFIVAPPITNSLTEKFYKQLSKSNEPYIYKWNRKIEFLVENKNISNSLKEKSELTILKYKYLNDILISIENMRYRIKKVIAYQEIIYAAKKYEALRFKDRGYPENEILDYPYILQYADYKNISFKESADTILFNAKIQESSFARSELLRLKYFNKIKNALTKKELEEVHTQFLLDFQVNI